MVEIDPRYTYEGLEIDLTVGAHLTAKTIKEGET